MDTISVQDGLQVHGRIHRLADFAKRPQFFDRLTELARTRLHLVEEPYILDGDHRLVGEGRSSSICLSVKGSAFDFKIAITPISVPFLSIGTQSADRKL